MNKFSDFADHTYCINLDSRKDRWVKVFEQFEELGIQREIERVSAIADNDPRMGCLKSHLLCIRKALKIGYKTILILEDDVRFLTNNMKIMTEVRNFLEKDNKWDLFYLGGNVMYPARFVHTHVFKSRFFSTHAYLISRRAFKKVLHATVPIDKWYAWNTYSYGLYPMCATQMETFSDIRKKVILNREESFDKSYNSLVKPNIMVRWKNYITSRYLLRYFN